MYWYFLYISTFLYQYISDLFNSCYVQKFKFTCDQILNYYKLLYTSFLMYIH